MVGAQERQVLMYWSQVVISLKDYILYRMDAPIGKTVYTCMLNKNAGVEADLTVSIQGTEQVRTSILHPIAFSFKETLALK